jgi:hypothetical protein
MPEHASIGPRTLPGRVPRPLAPAGQAPRVAPGAQSPIGPSRRVFAEAPSPAGRVPISLEALPRLSEAGPSVIQRQQDGTDAAPIPAATTAAAESSSKPDAEVIAARVYDLLVRRLTSERERLGP